MASNADILEARRYNRHRLLTAFVSGTPNGQEMETRLPTGPIIAGVVLSAVLVVVGLVLGKFAPTLPQGWDNGQLILATDTGSRYFSINGVLHPVTNLTSARLLADPTQFGPPIKVPESRLAGHPRGALVGLPGLPDSLPTPSPDVGRRWTACPDSSGTTHVWVGGQPGGYETATVAVVADGEAKYLVANGLRYLVRTEGRTDLLRALGLGEQPVAAATAEWLNLLNEGQPLAPLHVADAGQPASDMPSAWGVPQVGGLVEVNDNNAVQRYVISSRTALTPLTDVAYRLWDVGKPDDAPPPIRATPAQVAQVTVTKASDLYPADWPAELTASAATGRQPCVELLVDPVGWTVALGSAPQKSVPVAPSTQQAPVVVTVAGGSAALIRVSTGGSLGSVRLITDLKQAYGLGDDPELSMAQLGLNPALIVPVPESWSSLVPSADTQLSQAAVLATVKA